MTRQILQPIFGAALAYAALSAPPPRHPPVAIVDHLDARSITGSATDGDVPGRPVTLHIYVDGRLYDGAIANPRFEYRHAPFGAGKHRVEVYALGMDAMGRLDGQNIRATGPNIDDFGCAPLEGDSPAFVWCHDMPAYWTYRQLDTTPLFNKYIWIGVDNWYGGMIAQLYGEVVPSISCRSMVGPRCRSRCGDTKTSTDRTPIGISGSHHRSIRCATRRPMSHRRRATPAETTAPGRGRWRSVRSLGDR